MRTVQKIGERKTEKFGTFEFYLDEEGDKVKLVCKNEWRETETTYVGKVQGKNCMSIADMNLISSIDGKIIHYIELPSSVYNAFQYAKSNFSFRNICLHYAGQSAETGIKWYSLSAEVPREMWRKIAKYFSKFDRDEEDALYGELMGWLTANPKEVEKILGVKEELTLDYRIKEAEKRRKDEKKKEIELLKTLSEIKEAFNGAEKPDPRIESPDEAVQFQPGYEKMRVNGEEIQHPITPENIYGGGKWWVIQKEWIWYIKNNGHDGDCWSLNNVNTGGAGAIGVRVPYFDELANKIRKLKSNRW
jgi:hypothetical protein